MSSAWKQSITSFLNDKDEEKLRGELRKEWIDIYPEEKAEIYSFLFHGLQHKLFIYLFAVDLKSQITELPWPQALEILRTNKVKISEEFFAELVHNIHKLKQSSQSVTNLPELASEVRNKQRMQFLQKVLKLKQELIASARIAQSEQLIDQHVHYMNELKKISPREYNVTSLITEREKQRAEKIISKLSKRRQTRNVPRPQL